MSDGNKPITKTFWKKVKPFISTKSAIVNGNITIELEKNTDANIKAVYETIHIKENNIVSDENIWEELFNGHYINIVKNSSGLKPVCLWDPSKPEYNYKTVNDIITKYERHPSIIKIKELCNDLPEVWEHVNMKSM